MKNKTNTIETILQSFRKQFLTGTYHGDGEEMEIFLAATLLRVQEETREHNIQLEGKLKEFGYDTCPTCGMKLNENK